MKLPKTAILASGTLILASALNSQIVVQTDASYLAVPATSYSASTVDPNGGGGGFWSAHEDKTTSVSIADDVMIYADTLGADDSSGAFYSGNAAAGGKLTYTLDFTAADDYSVYIRMQGFGGGDSFFYEKNWNDPDFLGRATSMPVDSESYVWVRLTYDSNASTIPLPGTGVTQGYTPSSTTDWLPMAIDATQATSGNTVTYTIAGREGDFQVDGLVFYNSPTATATQLDAALTAAVPEPSTYALLSGIFAFGLICLRRRLRR